jgi:arthrofactin-type cyclic lipopeptide synthetase B
MHAPAAGIHELVARQVRSRPTAIAVRAGAASLTYAGLSDRAARLAHHLRATGVRRGTLVGVRVERGPDLVVALLAVLQAGGAYVLLDADPGYRVHDCRLRVVITTVRGTIDLPDTGGIVCLDLDRPLITSRSPIPPVGPVHGDQPAFIWYDGGPGGLVVPHAAVVHLARELLLYAHDTVPMLSPSTSPIAALELWAPLCRGATLTLTGRPPDLVAFPPAELVADLAAAGARLLVTTDLTPATAHRALRSRPGLRLIHCYTPRGSALPAAWRLVRRDAGPTLRCGQWAGGTRLRVFDDSGRRVPVGGTGTVFVTGPGVPLGYHRRPDLTRELFTRDPTVTGGRMLRTGDRATVLADGTLALHHSAVVAPRYVDFGSAV